jgi:hypothetical protein
MVSESGAYVGQIAHIRGVGVTSARHDPSMSDDDLRDKSNLILLCYDHHVESDDESRYTVQRMQAMKDRHESRFRKAYAEYEARFVDYTESLNAAHCQTLIRWLEVLGLESEDFGDEYVKAEAARINTVADRLSALTEEARQAMSFVVRYGEYGMIDNSYDFPLSEMARRTRHSKAKIIETFDELERTGFGCISIDSGFDGEPPHASVFIRGDGPSSNGELLYEIRSYCEQSGRDINEIIVGLRFDLLD